MTSGLAGVHAPENKQGPLGHPTCLPVVVLKTWPPVGCAQQGLHCAGQVHKHVAHEEKPEGIRYSIGGQAQVPVRRVPCPPPPRKHPPSWPRHHPTGNRVPCPSLCPLAGQPREWVPHAPSPAAPVATHMERMGATLSREAMRMPASQMRAVSSRAHVGSPLAFPWPNTCRRRAGSWWPQRRGLRSTLHSGEEPTGQANPGASQRCGTSRTG